MFCKATALIATVGAVALTAGWRVAADEPGRPRGSRPQAVKTDAPRAAGMREHFEDVTLVHEALIRGDLVAARKSAQSIVKRPGPAGLPDVATAHVVALRTLARHQLAGEALAATTTEARTRIYGALVARCAECHGLHRGIWGPGRR